MSKGLSYLAAMRPEAMGGLLKFYGKSVKALDDKTRLLISVATKVAVGTERGLRQYAPQALKAGASKEEILDAVLMSFPAAGLTKVVDAVHVLLEMDLLPSLDDKASAAQAAPQEFDLGSIAGFSAGTLSKVDTPMGRFIVFSPEVGVYRVYPANCPHSAGDLSEGTCDGAVVECPVHHWRFDLASGANLNQKLKGLYALPARVEGDRLIVSVVRS